MAEIGKKLVTSDASRSLHHDSVEQPTDISGFAKDAGESFPLAAYAGALTSAESGIAAAEAGIASSSSAHSGFRGFQGKNMDLKRIQNKFRVLGQEMKKRGRVNTMTLASARDEMTAIAETYQEEYAVGAFAGASDALDEAANIGAVLAAGKAAGLSMRSVLRAVETKGTKKAGDMIRAKAAKGNVSGLGEVTDRITALSAADDLKAIAGRATDAETKLALFEAERQLRYGAAMEGVSGLLETTSLRLEGLSAKLNSGDAKTVSDVLAARRISISGLSGAGKDPGFAAKALSRVFGFNAGIGKPPGVLRAQEKMRKASEESTVVAVDERLGTIASSEISEMYSFADELRGDSRREMLAVSDYVSAYSPGAASEVPCAALRMFQAATGAGMLGKSASVEKILSKMRSGFEAADKAYSGGSNLTAARETFKAVVVGADSSFDVSDIETFFAEAKKTANSPELNVAERFVMGALGLSSGNAKSSSANVSGSVVSSARPSAGNANPETPAAPKGSSPALRNGRLGGGNMRSVFMRAAAETKKYVYNEQSEQQSKNEAESQRSKPAPIVPS